jgi:hypothetical protein
MFELAVIQLTAQVKSTKNPKYNRNNSITPKQSLVQSQQKEEGKISLQNKIIPINIIKQLNRPI